MAAISNEEYGMNQIPQRRDDLLACLDNTTGPILMDGAMGTELLRRGIPTPLPLWSASANVKHAPVVEAIHKDYLAAGCRLITTNTFRTSSYAMERFGRGDRWQLWNIAAVQLARKAAGDRAWVLGSVTALEDCYRPDLVPEDAVLKRYHREQIALLAESGVDAILLETFNSLRELDCAYRLARQYDLPVFASVVLSDAEHLYDGSPLTDLVIWIHNARPDVFLLNCTSPEISDRALRRLLVSTDQKLGVYGNVGHSGGEMGFEFTHAYSTADYAQWLSRWSTLGMRVIGGCCGTTPEYMRKANTLLGWQVARS